MAYWYNIATKQVESDETRSNSDDVMGPYDTEDEARTAIASAAKNTEEWDSKDREWADKGATWNDEDLED